MINVIRKGRRGAEACEWLWQWPPSIGGGINPKNLQANANRQAKLGAVHFRLGMQNNNATEQGQGNADARGDDKQEGAPARA